MRQICIFKVLYLDEVGATHAFTFEKREELIRLAGEKLVSGFEVKAHVEEIVLQGLAYEDHCVDGVKHTDLEVEEFVDSAIHTFVFRATLNLVVAKLVAAQ